MVLVNKEYFVESASLESNIDNNPAISTVISNHRKLNRDPVQTQLNLVKRVDLSNYLYSPSSKLLVKTLKNYHQAFTTSSPNSSSDCADITAASNPSTCNTTTIKSFNEISTSEIDTTINNSSEDSTSKKSATSILFFNSSASISPSLTSSQISSNCASSSLTSSSSSFGLTNSSSLYSTSINSNSPLTLSTSSSDQSSIPSNTFKSILIPSKNRSDFTNSEFSKMMMMFSNNQNSNNNNLHQLGSSNSPTGNGNLIIQQLTNMNTINNSNISCNSDEHEELLAEMELIERLPTQERLKQAKRRRALQLKKWNDYEKTFQDNLSPQKTLNYFEKSKNIKQSNNNQNARVNLKRSIQFQDHIVLLDAIMRKDCDEIERLLDSGVTPNSANEDGLTAIHQCCIDDSAELLKLLIRYGADVNVCDNDLWTPLHAAATCANLEICKILIENKADLLAVNTDGNMPYDICDDEICLEYIESEMAAKGVTQQTIDMKRSETEMKMLDDLKQIYLQQLVLINNNKPNNKINNLKNNNFLNYFTNSLVNIKRNNGLIEQCLDLNAKDFNGATLMHIASANGYNSILLFLLNDCQIAAESGAPIIPPTLTCRDNDGWTPLHVATFWGHQKAIEILLENGADIDLRTNSDETVLELCDDPDVRDFIIQKSKEIDVHHKERQAQARAAAALQIKLQIINNSNNISTNNPRQNSNGINGSNGSIRSVAEKSNSYNNVNVNISSSNNSNNNILSSINNSTRSLKRTSTGVSRSSSVRRSSFRDKEKAARKLDTSFKDVLYASEKQGEDNNENIYNQFNEKQSDSNITTSLLNNEAQGSYQGTSYSFNTNEITDIKTKAAVPIVINHLKAESTTKKEDFVDNKNSKSNISAVVKIINNNTSVTSNSNKNTNRDFVNALTEYPENLNNDQELKSQSNVSYQITSNETDDHNNNQLKLNSKTNNSQINQIARIHSNGSGTFPIPHPREGVIKNLGISPNPPQNLTASSNFSTTSSVASSASMTQNNNNKNIKNSSVSYKNTFGDEYRDSSNKRNLIDNKKSEKSVSSSAAIIDVKTSPQNNFPTNSPTFSKIQQPKLTNNNEDGVKYKFTSNETIGAKASINNEFSDINIDVEQSKFWKCSKCIKCSIM